MLLRPVPSMITLMQMAANDVGSLLVYDKDRAGPGGSIPNSVDACVGIITERGMLAPQVLGSMGTVAHLTAAQYSLW